MTDREQLCKEFTELTGGHWHEFPRAQQYKDCFGNICNTNRGRRCACGASFNSRYKSPNPTYGNPADVLRVMKEFLNKDDFVRFARTVGIDYPIWGPVYIELWFIITPAALLKAAVVFLKEGE